MDEVDFTAPLQKALLSFQFIEECLKTYLTDVFLLARHRCAKDVPIDVVSLRKLIDKKTLGSLITLFSCVTSNTALVTDLKGLSGKRNFCAHQAFLLTYEEQNDHEFLRKHTTELREIADSAHDAMMRLTDEMKKLRERPTTL